MLFLTTGDSAGNDIRLQIVFGLTPSEARLAGYLLRGKSLAEISRHLLLSRETLKSQLSSLFKKTKTRRQGELIALLVSSLSVAMA
jgi:DNA-binding CsgD family transcriptional regulator